MRMRDSVRLPPYVMSNAFAAARRDGIDLEEYVTRAVLYRLQHGRPKVDVPRGPDEDHIDVTIKTLEAAAAEHDTQAAEYRQAIVTLRATFGRDAARTPGAAEKGGGGG